MKGSRGSSLCEHEAIHLRVQKIAANFFSSRLRDYEGRNKDSSPWPWLNSACTLHQSKYIITMRLKEVELEEVYSLKRVNELSLLVSRHTGTLTQDL